MRKGLAVLGSALLLGSWGCGGEVVTTGGALDLGDLGGFPDGVAPPDPSGMSSLSTVTVLDQRFDDLVPRDVEVYRLTASQSPPAGLVWRRGERVLAFADSASGEVRVWHEDSGVAPYRLDLFGSLGPLEEPVGGPAGAGAAGAPAPALGLAGEAVDELQPLFMTVGFGGSLVALDGRAVRILVVPPGARSVPREVWSGLAGGWATFGGIALRPGSPGELWFTAARAPQGPGVYRIRSTPGEGAWPTPEFFAPLPNPGSLAFSPDGRGLVAVGRDGSTVSWTVWDQEALARDSAPDSGVAVLTAPTPLEVDPARDYRGLVVDLGGNVYSAAPDGVEVFRLTGERLGVVRMPVPVRDLAWGQDGSWLYAAGPDGIYTFAVYRAAAGLPPGPPRVAFHTGQGSFEVRLDHGRAPVTVVNFLRFAHERFYEGTVFHRVIAGFVVQGGGFDASMIAFPLPRDPIVNEAGNGLEHRRGTLAMARLAAPDSATSQFFFNVVDNRGRGLEHVPGDPARAGYAVFGEVVQGMQVIDQISSVPVEAVREHQYVPVDPVGVNRVEVLP